jgi:hypothetical protein
MLSLFSSASKYRIYARQHNHSLVESNGCWRLYYDGRLMTIAAKAWDTVQFIVKELEKMKGINHRLPKIIQEPTP